MEWIFFDLGWVLVDETQAHLKRLEAVRNQLDFDISTSTLWDLCIKASTEFSPSPFLGMLELLGISLQQRKRIISKAKYDPIHEVLYPCVPTLLEKLGKDYKLGVIANQSRGTEKRLSNWGIRQHFSLIFASAEFGLSKPDPQIFMSALSKAQCSPDKTMMIGDRLDNDIGPAKSQGWKTTRVLQGFSQYQQPRNATESADFVLGGIEELAANHGVQSILVPSRNKNTVKGKLKPQANEVSGLGTKIL